MLPVLRTDQEWQAAFYDQQGVLPAAEDLAGRLGPAGSGLCRYPDGSRPVYAAGGRRVLKLYPTVSAPDSVTEARVLAARHAGAVLTVNRTAARPAHSPPPGALPVPKTR